MATQQQINSFVANNYASAVTASQQTGLPVDFILGQAGLESAYGTSNVANTTNNLFGITQTGGGYVNYPSQSASFAGYADYLTTNQRYSGLSSLGTSDPTAIATYLAQQGYNPNPQSYAQGVAGATSVVDQSLASLGLSGSAVPSTLGTAGVSTPSSSTVSSSSTNPSFWSDPTGYISSLLAKWGSSLLFIILGLILLVGAVFMYAETQRR